MQPDRTNDTIHFWPGVPYRIFFCQTISGSKGMCYVCILYLWWSNALTNFALKYRTSNEINVLWRLMIRLTLHSGEPYSVLLLKTSLVGTYGLFNHSFLLDYLYHMSYVPLGWLVGCLLLCPPVYLPHCFTYMFTCPFPVLFTMSRLNGWQHT